MCHPLAWGFFDRLDGWITHARRVFCGERPNFWLCLFFSGAVKVIFIGAVIKGWARLRSTSPSCPWTQRYIYGLATCTILRREGSSVPLQPRFGGTMVGSPWPFRKRATPPRRSLPHLSIKELKQTQLGTSFFLMALECRPMRPDRRLGAKLVQISPMIMVYLLIYL